MVHQWWIIRDPDKTYESTLFLFLRKNRQKNVWILHSSWQIVKRLTESDIQFSRERNYEYPSKTFFYLWKCCILCPIIHENECYVLYLHSGPSEIYHTYNKKNVVLTICDVFVWLNFSFFKLLCTHIVWCSRICICFW